MIGATLFVTAFATFFAAWVAVPALLGVLRLFGLYTTVFERRCKVYVLFGKVVLVLDEPGLHSLWTKLGFNAALVHFFGRMYEIDLRLDQEYLRSQPVNSEEGTPMGIGVWYEMMISNPVEYLFRNTDPRGSLRANVSNAAVRCLSNMPLENMLEDRHRMSRLVRQEVSPKSDAWGYKLGSVYIRKVHFRDEHMIRQIEQKVVNRLRQVTSAIRQAGLNQVSLIKSTAEKEAASEFARAAAMRPYLVGVALQEISSDKEVMEAMFEILETQKMLEGEVDLTLIPPETQGGLLSQLLASKGQKDTLQAKEKEPKEPASTGSVFHEQIGQPPAFPPPQ
jgi:regulator of protease activity HflC (stomatin/prohibitin superfamily)